MRTAAAALLALVTVVALSGCVEQGGPVGFAGLPETQCAPVRSGGSALIGIVFKSPSKSTMTLNSLQLRNPKGLRVVRTYVLPILDHTVLGVSSPNPDLPAWSKRRQASGATLTAGQTVNAVLELERTGPGTGTAQAVSIAYTVNGSQYQRTGNSIVKLKTQCP